MSLIPYHPREGREIVLRHHNSVVVRDPDSHRLEIRRTECPTCHQPLGHASSPERPLDRHYDMSHEYVNPDYFRMLRAGNEVSAPPNGPPSPVRRLFHPALAGTPSVHSTPPSVTLDEEAEFVSSTPGVGQAEGSRIRRNAFSPDYFKTFFVEETVLGRGGKGVVLLVRHEIDGCQLGHFACKRVPVGDDHAWLEKVLIEVELLAKLSHPNLVSYRHVWLEDVQLTRFGPSVACAFILQQYCNSGDLHQYVVGSAPREATKEELKARMRRRSKGQAEPPHHLSQAKPQLSFEDIYSFFKDITSGVAYLHAANYIHRDLKPNNCLLHREGGMLQCLISDFGEVQPENVVRKSTGSTGTISYCAPEVLKMDANGRYGNFTTKSDMFSLGMILYFMCFGRLPYQGANAIQEELEDIELLRAEIVDWKGFQDERRERTDLPPRLYKLLKKLLALDPAERPSANEVLIAMKSETSFDGITRGDRTAATSSSPRSSRVQNLDSPAPPGTPVPDPRKERTRRRMTPPVVP
ncbi:kinase [Hirsutella rhossiliensis]|uniref:non-specific serine/threonine protein kinase n=1 Tax=Hirsutella rhossiliensis TaxID=111463 RepID=A0A9P8SK56_9HYPO|nr:kinase [Hirsutella rhossiliensis]KAH0964894.1 kinase [Hirsutella rhossiliensis]